MLPLLLFTRPFWLSLTNREKAFPTLSFPRRRESIVTTLVGKTANPVVTRRVAAWIPDQSLPRVQHGVENDRLSDANHRRRTGTPAFSISVHWHY